MMSDDGNDYDEEKEYHYDEENSPDSEQIGGISCLMLKSCCLHIYIFIPPPPLIGPQHKVFMKVTLKLCTKILIRPHLISNYQ